MRVAGLQTFDLRTTIHVVTGIEAAMLDLLGQHLGVNVASCWATANSAAKWKCSATCSLSATTNSTPLPYQSQPDEK